MPTYVVLLGAPGAGKGTQAVTISEEMGLPHISSGDIFRENLKNETELGKEAAQFINAGELVPDDLTIKMIEDSTFSTRLQGWGSVGRVPPYSASGCSFG